MIHRNIYLEQFSYYKDSELVKVIVWQRRVGKSTLLLQIKDLYLSSGYHQDDIIYINKELPEYQYSITNDGELYDTIKSYKVILIDEIQDILQREKTIRGLVATGWYQIVITWSNSTLLSWELSSYLAGRYISIYVGSYSLSEFMQAHQLSDPEKARKLYLEHGSAPYFRDADFSKGPEYYKMLIDTIILRDISLRYDVRNIALLQLLLRYIASVVWWVISAHSITKSLKQQAIKLSNTTIVEYIRFLKQCFVVHGVMREDIRGKRILEDAQKLYFTDHGLRNTLVGWLTKDHRAGVLENIVYNHLRIHWREITVGQHTQEIDFIAKKEGKEIYIQVTYSISSDETHEREFRSLQSLHNNRPKYILHTDDYGINYSPREWIIYLHIIDFCLGRGW